MTLFSFALDLPWSKAGQTFVRGPQVPAFKDSGGDK